MIVSKASNDTTAMWAIINNILLRCADASICLEWPATQTAASFSKSLFLKAYLFYKSQVLNSNCKDENDTCIKSNWSLVLIISITIW